MADSDNTLNLAIKLGVIGKEDAAAVRDSLNEAKDAAQKLGTATSEEAGAMGKSAEGAHESGLKHGELEKVVHRLGDAAVPGLGRAISELGSGPLGVALVLIDVFEKLKAKIEDDEAAMDKLADLASKPINAGTEGLRKAFDEAATALGKFRTALTGGADDDVIHTQIERSKQLIAVELEGQKQITEALGKTEVARLRASGATPDQIAAAQSRTQAAVDAIDQKIHSADGSSGLIAEQTTRKAAQKDLENKAVAAIEAERAARVKFENDQATLKNARDALDPRTNTGKALADRKQKAVEALTEANEQPDIVSGMGMGPDINNRAAKAAAIKDAQDEMDKVNAAEAQWKSTKKNLEANEADRVQAVTTAEENSSKAQRAATTNNKRLEQLPGEIDQTTKVEGIQEHSARVVEMLNQHGGTLNKSLGELAAATNKTHNQTLNIVQSILDGHSSFQVRMAQLEAQLRGIHPGLK